MVNYHTALAAEGLPANCQLIDCISYMYKLGLVFATQMFLFVHFYSLEMQAEHNLVQKKKVNRGLSFSSFT